MEGLLQQPLLQQQLLGPISPLHLPYISPPSPLYLPYISPISALHLPYISPMPPLHLAYLWQYDFYPRASGKGNAVAHLQRRYGLAPAQCVALFDDDNDLPMARRCEGGQLLPGLTSKSVARAALEHPEWTVAARAGQCVFAIEELLEVLLEQARSEGREADALGTPEAAAAAEGLVLLREA